jgi:hypothetical protein
MAVVRSPKHDGESVAKGKVRSKKEELRSQRRGRGGDGKEERGKVRSMKEERDLQNQTQKRMK